MKPAAFFGYIQNNLIEVFNLRFFPILLASLAMLVLQAPWQRASRVLMRWAGLPQKIHRATT